MLVMSRKNSYTPPPKSNWNRLKTIYPVINTRSQIGQICSEELHELELMFPDLKFKTMFDRRLQR